MQQTMFQGNGQAYDLVADAQSFQLRQYQTDAVGATRNCFIQGHRRVLIIMPTGCGKTVVFAEMARQTLARGKRVLVLAHTNELIEQAHQKIARHAGTWGDIEMADSRAPRQGNLVIASVQTLRGPRLKTWDRTAFDLIVVDEAHHVVASTYRKILAYFGAFDHGARVVGVTATPDRGDDVNLGALVTTDGGRVKDESHGVPIFETIAFNYSLTDAVVDGHLVRIKGRIASDFLIDLSSLRLRKGDYSAGDLDILMAQVVAPLARTIAKECKGRKRVLVFMPGVKSGEMLANSLRAIGETSELISGENSRRDREARLTGYREGAIRFLVNCMLLTEGFDEPSIDAIVIGRPTRSRALFTQMVGRGTRLADGKSNVLLVNFSYSTKHKLATAYDLFADVQIGETVRKLAEKDYEQGELVDFLDALEEAKAELFDKSRILKRIRRAVKARMVSYDPLELVRLTGVDPDGELVVEFNGKRLDHRPGSATDKQRRYLWARDCRAFDWDTISMAQASLAISALEKHNNVEEAIKVLASS